MTSAKPVGDGRRPHRFPLPAPDGEMLAWVCRACGAVVRESGPREEDDCPADWRPERPKWTDLFGIDPEYTGGVPVEEWLEQSRGEA